jgi:hypothetical protein
MRDSGLLLFVSLFPYPFRSQTCAYIMRVAVNVTGVTSMGHEVREGHMKKASGKTYTCQNSYILLFYSIFRAVDMFACCSFR